MAEKMMDKQTLFQNSIWAKPKTQKQKSPKEADEFEDIFYKYLLCMGEVNPKMDDPVYLIE